MYDDPVKVTLTIQKQDADTGAVLANAGYRLYDAGGTQIAEGYTDASGNLSFSNLAIGTYGYQEFDPPDGYLCDTSRHSVTLDGSNTSVLEVHRDAPCKATLTINKQTADTLSPLSGAGYRLYDADGNQVREGYTDDNGTLIFTDLPLGSYTLKEFSAPDGFICSEDTTSFTFTDTHLSESVTLYNSRKLASITIRKVNAVGDKINGAAFLLESSTDGGNGWITVNQQLTDRNGYIVWDSLSTAPGTLYRLTETATVSGLSLQEKSIFEGSLPESGVYDVSFTVCNCAIPTLPFTGGSGFGSIPIFTLMLCIGVITIQILKKRKETV